MLRRRALNSLNNNFLSFLGCGKLGLFHDVFDVARRAGLCFVFEGGDQLFPGFIRSELADIFKHLDLLLIEFIQLFFAFFGVLQLRG